MHKNFKVLYLCVKRFIFSFPLIGNWTSLRCSNMSILLQGFVQRLMCLVHFWSDNQRLQAFLRFPGWPPRRLQRSWVRKRTESQLMWYCLCFKFFRRMLRKYIDHSWTSYSSKFKTICLIYLEKSKWKTLIFFRTSEKTIAVSSSVF